ncbi:MAG: ABC transporter ATP-binding protein [Candidatus Caccosoma sp.]|nr:ABC transporter ATP-binding protein [Candidatus Caccosoma sp.]
MYCILNRKNANLDYFNCLDEDIENLYFNAFDNVYRYIDIPLLLLNYIVNKAITFIIMLIAFYRINIFLVLFVVVTIIIDYLISKKSQKIKKKYDEEISSYSYKKRYLMECFENYKIGKEIRVFNGKDLLINKYNDLSNRILDIEKNINKNDIIFSIISKLIATIRLFVIYILAINKYLNDSLFLSEFLIYISAINQMADSFDDIVDCILMINNALYYFSDFTKYLNIEETFHKKLSLENKSENNVPIIEFENVSFKYPNSDAYTLKNISFKIFKNQVVSIVGDNGSGKSTLIKLILRLYDYEGNIYYNGQNIKNIDYDYYQSLFAATFQDYKMYCYSIKENIMFDKDIDNTKLEKVLQCLNIEKLINKIGLEANYSKRFDENGVELSNGESQKIAISRALYKNSDVFIFDEPTATIDPLAEYEIFKNIYNLAKQEKTVIFVSHRMGSTFYSNNTIVLDNGMIVENDNYKYLLNKDGLYAKMYNLQAKYYK